MRAMVGGQSPARPRPSSWASPSASVTSAMTPTLHDSEVQSGVGSL